MKIYTKTGDSGDTSLFGGQRVPKDALRVEAYGTVDELNAVIGVVLADANDARMELVLRPVQGALFVLGADLATPGGVEAAVIQRVTTEDALPLERAIDEIETELPPLRNFVLPGGSPLASRLHFARTVCRRAERAVVRLSRYEEIGEPIIIFLNRLSDLLFVLARYANHQARVDEIVWKNPRNP